MSLLGPLGVDVDMIRRRTGLMLAGAAIAAPAAFVALGFAARAGEIALGRRFAPDVAALIVAATAAVVALSAVVAVVLVLGRTRRDVSRAMASSAVIAVAPTAASLALRHTRLAAVVAAVGIGFWMARRGR